MKLTDYASNVYSQYGEDGIIQEIVRRIQLDYFKPLGTCVEFGASDGLACSNTANLWRHQNWIGLLIEADGNYLTTLSHNAVGHNVTVKIDTVTPSNVDSLIGKDVDLLSIDIDGDDFWVFCSMHTRAKVLLIEYNRTIPPHLDLVPKLGSKLGIGARTLVNAAAERGYTFLGLTEGNCIFVDTSYDYLFDDLEKDLAVLQPPESFMYLATDFEGRIIPLGHTPPWGLAWPKSATQFRPNQDGLLDIQAIESTERVLTGLDSLEVIASHIADLRSAAMQSLVEQGWDGAWDVPNKGASNADT
jgi:hypothetical protein